MVHVQESAELPPIDSTPQQCQQAFQEAHRQAEYFWALAFDRYLLEVLALLSWTAQQNQRKSVNYDLKSSP